MRSENSFQIEAREINEKLIQWRRALHQIPEVGTQLPQTMAYIREQLDEMGISYKFYSDISCIEATIGEGEKCFLLRSDVDAIPIMEETELPFRSINGSMHGCGHDLHATILLGAAKLLKMHEKELKGMVKLLFQSGKEVFQSYKLHNAQNQSSGHCHSMNIFPPEVSDHQKLCAESHSFWHTVPSD